VECTHRKSMEILVPALTYLKMEQCVNRLAYANSGKQPTAGGKFLSRMEAKNCSFGFDFEGVYYAVAQHQFIHYTMGDGRTVSITFESDENETKIT